MAEYGLAITTGSVLSAVTTLRIEQTILVADDEQDARNLAWSSTYLGAIVVAIVCVAVVLAWGINTKSLVAVSGAMLALSNGLVTISQQLLIRGGRSNEAGRAGAFRSGVAFLLTVGVAFLGNHQIPIFVLAGLLASSIVVSLYCIFDLWREIGGPSGIAQLRASVRRHADVWVPYFFQSGFSGLSLNLPYFVFYATVSPTLCAGYLLAERIVRLPVNLISTSVRSHLVHDFRGLLAAGKREQCLAAVKRWSRYLLVAGVLFAIGAAGVVWVVSGLVKLDEKWMVAVQCILVLSIWSGAVLSNSPSAAALTVTRNNKYVLNAQIVELAGRAVLLMPLFYLGVRAFFFVLFLAHLPSILYRVATYRKAVTVM